MTDSEYPGEILQSLEDYNIDIRDFLPGHGSGAKLLLNFNKISGIEQVKGIVLKGREIENGIVADVVIKKGTHHDEPIHLCFGVNKESGIQEIFPRIIAEDDTDVKIQAHCSFPNS
jgi:Fe-S cluster assembly scaffold protein SufB